MLLSDAFAWAGSRSARIPCRWADVLVIAPLSANTLAKLALGLSDNLLTCIVRAWDWQHDPVVVSVASKQLGCAALHLYAAGAIL